MSDIFISYSSHDRDKAERLVALIEKAGYSVWIDRTGISGAKNWSAEIVEAINDCSIVIFLISPESLNSDNVAREIHLASEKKKNLFPVLLTEVRLPTIFEYPLAGLQRVHYDDSAGILRGINGLLAGAKVIGNKTFSLHQSIDDGFIHLAVLPFADLSPLGDNEWFADGMMDELITTLRSLKKLRVAGRSDVLYYKKHHMKAREVADELGVRYLVEGGVRKAGQKIRISASLTDTVANHQLWSNNFDGSFDDIFDFQDSVSRQIVEALKLTLTPEEEEKVLADPTQNTEAYEFFLKAMTYLRRYTREGYEHSLKLFDEALLLDENFADAYVEKSHVYATYYREYSRERHWIEKAIDAIERAEKISSVTAMTLRARSEIALLHGDYNEAELLILRAVATEPGYKELYNLLGNIYRSNGKLSEAAKAFEKVLSFSKDYLSYYNLMVILSMQDKSALLVNVAAEAIPCTEKYIRRNPDEIFPKLVLAYSFLWSGRATEALAEAERLFTDPHHDATTLYNLGSLFEELGDLDKNFELISRSVQKGFRQIEVLRNSKKYSDPLYQQKLDSMIIELEHVIEEEHLGIHASVTDKEQNRKL